MPDRSETMCSVITHQSQSQTRRRRLPNNQNLSSQERGQHTIIRYIACMNLPCPRLFPEHVLQI